MLHALECPAAHAAALCLIALVLSALLMAFAAGVVAWLWWQQTHARPAVRSWRAVHTVLLNKPHAQHTDCTFGGENHCHPKSQFVLCVCTSASCEVQDGAAFVPVYLSGFLDGFLDGMVPEWIPCIHRVVVHWCASQKSACTERRARYLSVAVGLQVPACSVSFLERSGWCFPRVAMHRCWRRQSTCLTYSSGHSLCLLEHFREMWGCHRSVSMIQLDRPVEVKQQ